MFSLQASSDEMLLLALLSRSGSVLSPQCPAPAAIRALPCGSVPGKPSDVATRAAELLSQEHAGSRQHSSAPVCTEECQALS